MVPPSLDSRRAFLKLSSFLLGGVVCGTAATPVIGAALSPLFGSDDLSEAVLLPAGKLSELTVGTPRRVELVSTVIDGWTRSTGVVGAVWLLRRADDSVLALSTVCPHSGCSINLAAKNVFTCPCHDSEFSLEGVPNFGPSPRSMDPMPVEIRDDVVLVRHVRYRIGVKEREEV